MIKSASWINYRGNFFFSPVPGGLLKTLNYFNSSFIKKRRRFTASRQVPRARAGETESTPESKTVGNKGRRTPWSRRTAPWPLLPPPTEAHRDHKRSSSGGSASASRGQQPRSRLPFHYLGVWLLFLFFFFFWPPQWVCMHKCCLIP